MKLFGEEFNNSEIGRRLGVCNQTVSRWRKQYHAGGKAALCKAGRAGRKPRLSAVDVQRLAEAAKQGPERLGYQTPLWTCWRVAHLIEQEFGITYHAGTSASFCGPCTGACSAPPAAPWSATKKPSAPGSSNTGPPLKKSPKRRAHDRLHRRKRIEPAPASLPHLVAARPDSSAPVSLQLEDHLGGGGHDHVELRFPDLRKSRRQGAGRRISGEPGPADRRPDVDHPGSASGASQPPGRRVRGISGGTSPGSPAA